MEKAKGNLALTSLPLTTTSFSDVAAVALVESTIEKIWLTVLGIESVKITDNFFDIGGHSLSLVKVQQAIEKATGILLSIADFFKYTTIEALAIAVSAQMLPSENQQQSQPTAVSEERQTRLADDEMIAIIGMGIRAPLADNVDEYWQNLKAGRDCITRFSEEEVNAKTRAQFVDHGEAWVKAGGLLNDVYGFDNHFFGMSEFEAKQMDPQQRILLECVADALDDGGLGALARKERISLFVGATPSHYGANADASVSGAESLVAEVSSNIAFIATRISHRLNLKGESIMVNTLCSTSLVATHMAVTSLLTGSSDYAIAGGVTIEAPQKVGYLYEPNFIMSPNGQCRTFDKDANGTVPGNGAGVVLMRRLSDALADGDPIHAIVRASAVNNDGHDKVGYYAPSVQGQAEVIKRAHQIAGISADSISYVEAHGTATKMGDPIEVSALTEAFSQSTSAKGFCGIGSVKSNIGHLGDAAGIAGLIKTVLCLKNAYLPASLHYETPNPNIDLANSPFYVIAEGQPWAQGQGPRRAGVSSYGIGGTNAHVILEEAP
jgi:acyl transferase domain-containing protein/acyl carrier protein